MERTDPLRLRRSFGTRDRLCAGRVAGAGNGARLGGARVGERTPCRGADRELSEASGPLSRRDRGEPAVSGRCPMTSMPLRWLIAFLTALGVALPVAADEFRPAYLQLHQFDAVTYDVLWKLPALDETTTMKIHPVFPDGTRALTPVRSSYATCATALRWRVAVEGGLAGKAIEFPGLSASPIDVLVRVERSDGTVQLERVLPVEPRFIVIASHGSFDVVRTYT